MKHTVSKSISDPIQELDIKKKLWIFAGVLLGILLSSLDQTIVGTAMPKVIASLGGMKMYAWTFTAYMLASTASVPIFGKLSDMYGRKTFFIGSMLLFMTGSMLCGASQNMLQLIVFRGIQGISAGSLVAIAYALIGDIFPPKERGRYQGYIGAVYGISSVFGPTLGGFLTDQLNWRWVFYVNIPVGLIAVTVLLWKMPRIRSTVKESIDYLGVALLLAASVPMLLAFSLAGNDYAWSSPFILGLFAASGLAWVGFFFAEKYAPEPIVPMDLFLNPTFSIANIASLLVTSGMFCVIVFMPLLLQVGNGVSTTGSGMLLTPMMITQVLASVFAGQIIARTGRFKWLALSASAVMAVGLGLMAWAGNASSHIVSVLIMIVYGLGLGITYPVYTVIVQASSPRNRLGISTATLQFFRNIGGTIGVALFGAILNNHIHHRLASAIPASVRMHIPPDRLNQLTDPRVLTNPQALSAIRTHTPLPFRPVVEGILETLRHAVSGGIEKVFIAGFILVLISIPFLAFMKDPKELRG